MSNERRMSDRSIALTMNTRYVGNVKEALQKDLRTLKAAQRLLSRDPLTIPIKLDLQGAKNEAAKVRDVIFGELGKGKMSGILGADGKAAVSNLDGIRSSASELGRVLTTSLDASGNAAKRYLQTVEQVGKGVERITKREVNAQGDPINKKAVISEKGKSPLLRDFENTVKDVNDGYGRAIGKARGTGDRVRELDLLKAQKEELNRILELEKNRGLLGSKSANAVEQRVTRIGDRIETLGGREELAGAKAQRAEYGRRVGNILDAENRRVQALAKINQQRLEEAKLIENVSDREREMTRLMKEREGLFARSRDRLRRFDEGLQGVGRQDLADRAMRRGLVMDNQVNQTQLEGTRMGVRSTLEERKRMSAAERKVEAERLRAMRALEKQRRSEEAIALERELQDIKLATDKRIAAIKRDERRVLAAVKSKADKILIAEAGAMRRAQVYGESAGLYAGVSNKADAAGHGGIGLKARAAAFGLEAKAVAEHGKLETAARKSGHALDFHSGGMLRNAATFTKWMLPAMGVTKIMQAFNAGLRSSTEVNKQFATLRAVYRGTEQDAQKLKIGTLELASAQGRSSQEAMDSTIRWSRLGLTRVQILEATRVSLMAANVAEMTAAETSEKLSAIYAAYRLRVGDLPVLLSRLNAISNRYNVTNKDLLEGLVRVVGVARQVGLELRDLEGIIGAVTGATGRPGQEVGNALKFVITRITDPKTVDKLRDSFNIDLTDANGDIMKFSDILRELAAVFPTLNKAEKSAFLSITAGSRQSARFAEVLDQYRQSQILAAEAAFDTSSAFQENQKILESLQSRLDSLSSSWTRLFTAIGDTGVFSLLGSAMDGLSEGLDGLSSGSEKFGEFISGIGKNPGQEDSDGDKAMNYFKNTWRNAFRGLGSMPLIAQYNRDQLISGDIWKDQHANAEEFSDEISKVAGEVNALRERLGGLERGAGVFEHLSDSIKAGSVERNTMIKDFEGAAHLLLNLENGTNLYADAVTNFYAALNAGDTSQLVGLMEKLRRLLLDDSIPTENALNEKRGPAIETLRKKLIEVEKERAAMAATRPETSSGIKSKSESIEQLIGEARSIQSAIEQMSEAPESFKLEGLSQEETGRIDKFFRDTLKQAEMLGDLLNSMGGDSGALDPVGRMIDQKRRSLELGVELLKSAQQSGQTSISEARFMTEQDLMFNQMSRSELVPGRDNSVFIKSLDDDEQLLKRRLDKLDEIEQRMKTAIEDEREKADEALRYLKTEEEIARVKFSINEGGRQAGNVFAGALVGENDTARTLNQTRAALAAAQDRLEVAKAGNQLGFARMPTEAGAIFEAEKLSRENILNLERKQFELAAARKNLAYDQLAAEKQQSQEASKRLQMAGREDQLRAAALSRTLRDSGDVTSNEFSYLSQSSKQAFQNFLPNKLPGDLNDVNVDFSRRREEMDAEIGLLSGSLGNLRNTLSRINEEITNEMRKNGSLDVIPESGKAPFELGMRDKSERPPDVNLDLRNLNIRVEISKELERVTQQVTRIALVDELGKLERRLDSKYGRDGRPTGAETGQDFVE